MNNRNIISALDMAGLQKTMLIPGSELRPPPPDQSYFLHDNSLPAGNEPEHLLSGSPAGAARHAAALTRSGKVRRFGFITTNSITQTFNRKVIEQHLVGAPLVGAHG